MQNPFFNPEENRLRAFFRICLFIILFAFGVGVSGIIPIRWLGMAGASFVVLGLYYLSFKFMDVRPWSQSGLILNRRWWLEFFAGVLIAASVMGLIFLTEWLSGDLEIIAYVWEGSKSHNWVSSILVFLIMMLSVGFYEEVMARGYLIRNMAEGFTFASITPRQATIIAVLLSSALFGLAHAGNPNSSIFAVVNIVLAGIMLAIPFVITERLSLPIGLHFAWNFFQAGVFGFPVSGMNSPASVIHISQGGAEWWTGGGFGPEGGVIGILGILVILLLTIYFLKLTGVETDFATSFKEKFNSET